MESAKLNDLIQIVGFFAVVVSLIFVGLQMRQSQEIAIASQYQERASIQLERINTVLQNGEYLTYSGRQAKQVLAESEGWSDLKAQVDSMSPAELEFRVNRLRHLFMANDNNHYQYQSGFLAADTWYTYRDTMQRSLRTDMSRFFWSRSKQTYRPDYQEAIDELIAENDKNE